MTTHELVSGVAVRLSEHVLRVLAPNPSVFTGPGTNSYLIVDGDDVTVLDPGPADATHLDVLERAARELGGHIRRIVCTHTHEDHSPGAAPLAQRTGAQLIGNPAPHDGYNDTSFVPDRIPVDGEIVHAGRLHLRAIATPGHVSNHVCFLLENEGLLFTGDHLMQGSTVVIVPPEGSMRAYLDSLRRLEAFDIRTIAPGHGHLMLHPQQIIAATIRHRLAREAKTLRALREAHGGTLDTLVPAVYDDVPAAMHPIARLSLEAHLIKLMEDGVLRQQDARWELV